MAAFRTTSTTRDSVFFTNYVHESGLSETEEFSGRKVIHNCYVWEVAAVCLTIPPLFPPLLVGMFLDSVVLFFFDELDCMKLIGSQEK